MLLLILRQHRQQFTDGIVDHYSAATEIYTLSLHDALPIWWRRAKNSSSIPCAPRIGARRPSSSSFQKSTLLAPTRSEEHTSELQSPYELVCRLLLEKKRRWI